MALKRYQMEPPVGKVSLALSYLWDGVTATQLGELQWSLLPANSHRYTLLQKNHRCQGFPPIFKNYLQKKNPTNHNPSVTSISLARCAGVTLVCILQFVSYRQLEK